MATERSKQVGLTLQQFIAASPEVDEQAEEATIFFADLVGSTEYKMDR
ncbi:MAG: hypothetical protein IH986_18695, partial [Planctomycetes bacterium]|nr:hypothetical protein [Planctomycetota bacterium]